MGLEKIIDRIIQDAQAEADRIVQESRNKAEEIKKKTREQQKENAQTLIQEAVKKGNLEASRIVTQARLEKRISLLDCKKELIDQVLERAFQKESFHKRTFRRKIIMKDGEKEEALDQERLKQELRPRLETYIAEVLEI